MLSSEPNKNKLKAHFLCSFYINKQNVSAENMTHLLNGKVGTRPTTEIKATVGCLTAKNKLKLKENLLGKNGKF